MLPSLIGKRVFVAGHNGMLGSAIVRRLQSEDCEIIVADRDRYDLTQQNAVSECLASFQPDVVIVAAAKVGGILANNVYPASFIYDNLMIAANVIEAAHKNDVNRLLFLGSSCIYPKAASQPISETALLTGPLEPTNEWYAVAKIAGIKLAQAYRKQYGRSYISAMPTNLYGPGDNFDLMSSHVLPALMRKAHEAKIANESSITVWGTGKPRREFLHVDDCADACVFLLNQYDGDEHVNVGSGFDIRIFDLVLLLQKVIKLNARIEFDESKPDGTFRKLMNSTKLNNLGWSNKISLEDGVSTTYDWFLQNLSNK